MDNWILEQLDNDKLEKEVLTLSVVALHILSALTKEDLTGIELATKLSVTRGGVTRAVQNLIKYQFLTTYQSESDKKKIFYHLTVKGRKVATIHDKMHKIMDIKLGQIFNKYNEQEKSIILSFLSDLLVADATSQQMGQRGSLDNRDRIAKIIESRLKYYAEKYYIE